jgi:hypothetical protein
MVRVKHIYYTMLAFTSLSKASVMRSHMYLKELADVGKVRMTVIKEGLYNKS